MNPNFPVYIICTFSCACARQTFANADRCCLFTFTVYQLIIFQKIRHGAISKTTTKMSIKLDKDSLEKLKSFIDICKKQPEILHQPELEFFRKFVESLGGTIPEVPTKPPQTQPQAEPAAAPEMADSEPESDLELDNEGCITPDEVDSSQKMGDAAKEVSEEDSDKADEKRREAMGQFSEGNIEKAIELYTEAIELNPQSALLFAKRGQAFLKLNKPNACIKDCSRALELNCDSAAAYKFRGRAYRLLGKWEEAAKDLRQACNIDFDEQTDEWLKEVTPNAKKIEQHRLKQERKKLEREERERAERLRKAREAHAQAAKAGDGAAQAPEEESGAGAGIGDFYKLLQDPDVMAAFQDPDIAAAFQDISTNPSNFIKYQSNPKVMAFISKLSSKFAGSGFPAGAFPGGFPGFPGAGAFGGAPTQPPPNMTDDDGLD